MPELCLRRLAATAAISRFHHRNPRRRALLAGVAGLGCLLAAAHPGTPRLVWNASASLPIGLYRVEPNRPIVRGDLVLAWLPDAARRLAAARHYLPDTVPLVKRVAAVPGDTICAVGAEIFVNEQAVAARRQMDGQGRPLPVWTGCRLLTSGQVFLLADAAASFDGRYFGPIATSKLIGRLVPLWTR